jgi:hypothetical protein
MKMSWKLTDIARLDHRRPKAVRLALLASLAARIEPALLRRLRLEVGPDLDLDVGSEADLWFSPLVESRNPVAMVLRPDAAAELRHELYGHDPDRARRARQVVAEVHAQAPPTIQLLESLAWLALSESRQVEIEEALRPLEHYPTKLDRQNRDSQRETDERVCFQA